MGISMKMLFVTLIFYTMAFNTLKCAPDYASDPAPISIDETARAQAPIIDALPEAPEPVEYDQISSLDTVNYKQIPVLDDQDISTQLIESIDSMSRKQLESQTSAANYELTEIEQEIKKEPVLTIDAIHSLAGAIDTWSQKTVRQLMPLVNSLFQTYTQLIERYLEESEPLSDGTQLISELELITRSINRISRVLNIIESQVVQMDELVEK
jgi:hypothetical protein